MELSWHDSVVKVLTEAGRAMHYTDIAEQIVARRLRKTPIANPAQVVNYTITNDINNNGERSTFRRVGRGEYILASRVSGTNATSSKLNDEEAAAEEVGIIHAFGMFWRRHFVQWTSKSQLLGQQSTGSKPVNFADQIGVYILYDGKETVYVGRAHSLVLKP